MKYLTDDEIHERAERFANGDKRTYKGRVEEMQRERQRETLLEEEVAEAAITGWRGTSKAFRDQWLTESTNWDVTDEVEAPNSLLLQLYEVDRDLAVTGKVGEGYIGTDLCNFVNGKPAFQREIGTVKEATFIRTEDGQLIAHDYRGDEENDAKAIAAKWNWCVENCKGTWLITHTEDEHDCYGWANVTWSVSITDEGDAARFMVAF